MISLNYQTRTNPMLLNRALFELNGFCGYVLKPAHLTKSPTCHKILDCRLTIRILCAFNLPVVDKSIVDPFVQIKLFGTTNTKGTTRSTKVIRNNGLNPQWNKEYTFNIDSADLPFVFVRFKVFDQNIFRSDKLIGQRMIAFDAIGEGYRNISLFDGKNKVLDHSKLVVEIEKDWWDGQRSDLDTDSTDL